MIDSYYIILYLPIARVQGGAYNTYIFTSFIEPTHKHAALNHES